MENLKVIVCASLLVLTLSVTTLAKTGTISTTKGGTISTTRTGTISTTAIGTVSNSRGGTISTTRTGIISTTGNDSTIGVDRFRLLNVFLSVFGLW